MPLPLSGNRKWNRLPAWINTPAEPSSSAAPASGNATQTPTAGDRTIQPPAGSPSRINSSAQTGIDQSSAARSWRLQIRGFLTRR